MLPEKYQKLDDFAAPNNYVAPPSEQDIAYIVCFRDTCKRYSIDFSKADPDEREFVIHMAEKKFFSENTRQVI